MLRLALLIIVLSITAAAACVWLHNDNAKITIAVDAGHGGSRLSEKGYVSSSGVLECALNNAVAIELEKILTKRGYKVIFTKPPLDNMFLTLQKRPEAANSAGADLLISIHHDAGDGQKRGFGIFYSSYKVNLDDNDLAVLYNGKEYPLIAERIVADENGGSYSVITLKDGASIFEINNIDDQYIVKDKTPCPTALDSKKLAETVYDKMLALDYIQPKGARKDAVADHEYRVLRYAGMPSVLIEAGYMSNPAELAEIQKSENQRKLALAVADAVDAYFGK